MKVGDLVKWIGYPGQSQALGEHLITGPVTAGVIIEKVTTSGNWEPSPRYDVAWGDGTIGTLLYENTIEVIEDELSEEQLDVVQGGMSMPVFDEWRARFLNGNR